MSAVTADCLKNRRDAAGDTPAAGRYPATQVLPHAIDMAQNIEILEVYEFILGVYFAVYSNAHL